MGKFCALKACPNRDLTKTPSAVLRRHIFPSTIGIRQQWEAFVNKCNNTTDFRAQSRSGAYICSEHFSSECFHPYSHRLVRDAVPTIVSRFTAENAFKWGLIPSVNSELLTNLNNGISGSKENIAPKVEEIDSPDDPDIDIGDTTCLSPSLCSDVKLEKVPMELGKIENGSQPKNYEHTGSDDGVKQVLVSENMINSVDAPSLPANSSPTTYAREIHGCVTTQGTSKRKYYVGDFSPGDFATPGQSKRYLDFVNFAVSSARHRLKMAQQKLRRAKKKIKDMESVISQFKEKKEVSDTVAQLIERRAVSTMPKLLSRKGVKHVKRRCVSIQYLHLGASNLECNDLLPVHEYEGVPAASEVESSLELLSPVPQISVNASIPSPEGMVVHAYFKDHISCVPCETISESSLSTTAEQNQNFPIDELPSHLLHNFQIASSPQVCVPAVGLGLDELKLVYSKLRDNLLLILPLHWTAVLSEHGLHVLQLSRNIIKAVQRSLLFKPDGTISFHVHNVEVPVERYLKGVCLLLPSVKNDDVGEFCDKVFHIINKIRSYEICRGLDNAEYMSVWKYFPECEIDNNPHQECGYSRTLRSNQCERLVNPKRWCCNACSKYFDPLKRKAKSALLSVALPTPANVYLTLTDDQKINKLKKK